jgi:segregation and condensation protein A
MSYEVKLEVFEGPLDLLLHLINRNELSITDIPIALITQQYLETIELMKSLNLEVAGEYLVMAAYLTHIKSQMLLPVSDEDQEDGESLQDPRDELVAHLLEYKRYKEATENLGALTQLDRDIFVREPAEDESDFSKAKQPLEVSLPQLLHTLRELLARTARRDLIELEPERLHVKDKIHDILERLNINPQITFRSLFEASASRINILTTFLALLEIIKLQLVRFYQDEPFGTILISKRILPEKNEANDANLSEGLI